jgi:hypothetical protein
MLRFIAADAAKQYPERARELGVSDDGIAAHAGRAERARRRRTSTAQVRVATGPAGSGWPEERFSFTRFARRQLTRSGAALGVAAARGGVAGRSAAG